MRHAVVASALPGVADVARTGGLVARPGDAEHLRRRLRAALANGTLLRGHELAERARNLYSWDAVVDRMERVYEETLARRRDRIPIEVTPAAHPLRHPVP